jgi:hypothetical protein
METMMSDPVTISLIGAVTTVLVSALNVYLAFENAKRGQRNEAHLLETKDAVTEIVKQTNGIQKELIKVTGEAEFAKGLKAGEQK